MAYWHDISGGKVLMAVAVAAVAYAGASFWQGRDIPRKPGILAPNPPLQAELAKPATKKLGAYNLTLLARFDITARVLSKKDYSGESFGDIAPLDLALGWGAMSDTENLEHLRIRQSDVRTYGWRYEDASLLPSLAVDDIHRLSANMHMVPATESIKKQLFSLRRGSVVHMRGYLVNFEGPEGVRTTSLTREDTGWGSCKIVYVEEISELKRP